LAEVSLTGVLRCASDAQVAAVRRHLPEHVRLTRAEPGCLFFAVTESDDPRLWRVEERFRDAAAFQAHQTRTRASLWARETADIARDYSVHGLD